MVVADLKTLSQIRCLSMDGIKLLNDTFKLEKERNIIKYKLYEILPDNHNDKIKLRVECLEHEIEEFERKILIEQIISSLN